MKCAASAFKFVSLNFDRLSLDRYTETLALVDAVLNSLVAKSADYEDDQALLQKLRELRQSMVERQASQPEPLS